MTVGSAKRLRDSCQRILSDSDRIARAAADWSSGELLHEAAQLMDTVTAHVALANEALAAAAQRRLLHDHHRMLQLARAMLLAAEDVNGCLVRDGARKLYGVVSEHARRESGD